MEGLGCDSEAGAEAEEGEGEASVVSAAEGGSGRHSTFGLLQVGHTQSRDLYESESESESEREIWG